MNWNLLFAAWLVACVATAGSLFFSEVMNYPPCALCWYQRIAMYPLVVVMLPAVLNFDRAVIKYVLPLAGIGFVISVYHNLVYYGVVPESLSPCSMGVSCKAQFVQWLGFIDIPQMALIAFSAIIMILIQLRRRLRNEG